MQIVRYLLDFFESRIPPFPEEQPSRPPGTLWPFLWYFVKGSWVWLLLMAFMSAIVSLLEVSLFSFLGNLVDWLGNREAGSLFERDTGTSLCYFIKRCLAILS